MGEAKIILLADDDAPVRRVIGRTLAAEGYVVHEAENGLRAREILETTPQVDLLITDMVMDTQSGEELIEYLKEARPDVPIITMSGSFSSVDPNAAARLGVAGAIGKPFKRRDLLDLAHSILGPE